MSEPRSHVEIFRDLLRIAVERQWQEKAIYMGCGDYADGCPDCSASNELTVGEYRRKEGTRYERGEHKPGCPTAALISEARGFLGVEDPSGEIP